MIRISDIFIRDIILSCGLSFEEMQGDAIIIMREPSGKGKNYCLHKPTNFQENTYDWTSDFPNIVEQWLVSSELA